MQTPRLSRQIGWHVNFRAPPKARMLKATRVRQDCHIPLPSCYMQRHMMHETHQCRDGKVRFKGDSAENDAFTAFYVASQRTVLSKCLLLVCGCWCTVQCRHICSRLLGSDKHARTSRDPRSRDISTHKAVEIWMKVSAPPVVRHNLSKLLRSCSPVPLYN